MGDKKMSNGDYTELKCPFCGLMHWIPSSLWDVCVATKNDPAPKSAFCPYGHSYAARKDEIRPSDSNPPPPQNKKKPSRFWQFETKKKNNIIELKGRK